MSIDWHAVRRRLDQSQQALERALTPDAERTAAVYRTRALQLAGRRTATGATAVGQRYLTFFLGVERYGLPFAAVAELLPFAHCTPVPGAPVALIGVMNIHGEILSVLQLGRLLELPGYAAGPDGYVLLLKRPGGLAVLRVDRLDRIQLVTAAETAVQDDTAAGALAHHLQGIATDQLRLLDPAALLLHPLLHGAAAPARPAFEDLP